MSFKTPLTVLENSAATHRTTPVFRLPSVVAESGAVEEWQTITYEQFRSDVERFARYWLSTLNARHVDAEAVVGIW